MNKPENHEGREITIEELEEALTYPVEAFLSPEYAEAEKELQNMEQELKNTLAAAKARNDGTGDNVGTAAGV